MIHNIDNPLRKVLSILLLFILTGLSLTTLAQTNPTEAKAAYLLAEESYGKGDYKTVLRYLEATKQSLGSSNSKMLYLWIQTEIEINKTDPGNIEKILALIAEFEKLSDVESFNEEKVLEIAKIKLTLKTQLSDAKEKAQKEAKDKFLTEGTINAYEKSLDYPLGSSLADLQVKHPDFAKAIADRRLYKQRIVKTKDAGGIKIIPYKQMILSFDHDVLKHISENKILFSYSDPGHVKGKAKFKKILDDFILKYGYMPNPIIFEDKTSNVYSESYLLDAGRKKILLSYSYASNNSMCIFNFEAKND